MSQIEIFSAICKALPAFETDKSGDVAIETARLGLESALEIWLMRARERVDHTASAKMAVACLDGRQLRMAIRGEGSQIYANLLAACSADLSDLTLEEGPAGGLSNADIEVLKAKGFDYDAGEYRDPAADWLVRGAAYAQDRFRKAHPRKDPVLAYIERFGFRLPVQQMCSEGALMFAAFLDEKSFSAKAQTQIMHTAYNADWRIVACLLIAQRLPDTLRLTLQQILGKERKKLLLAALEPGSSHHQVFARHDRISKLPPFHEILVMPTHVSALDNLLIAMDIDTSTIPASK
jgi:hypothetical protein